MDDSSNDCGAETGGSTTRPGLAIGDIVVLIVYMILIMGVGLGQPIYEKIIAIRRKRSAATSTIVDSESGAISEDNCTRLLPRVASYDMVDRRCITLRFKVCVCVTRLTRDPSSIINLDPLTHSLIHDRRLAYDAYNICYNYNYNNSIGSEHFIGLAGSGASIGVAVGWFEWTAILILLLLGFVFVPIYLKSQVYTVPEFFERRFNPACRTFLAVFSLIIYIFTKISVTIFAGAIVFDAVLGWNLWVSAGIIMAATSVYTIAGGLRAVVYTEVVQAVVLVFGALTLMGIGLHKVGGLEQLKSEFPDMFHLFHPATHKDFPWTGVLFGMPASGIWYWCSDQVIVQRVLAAKNTGHAQSGTIFAGFLKILTMFMLVIPGIIAAKLFPEEVARDSNKAFPLLVVRLMPAFMKGIMVSAMVSAAMSSLASVYNSTSTIFTMDVYRKLRKNSSQNELVLVGRVATVILVFLGLFWVPFISGTSDKLYIYVNSVSSYTAPPITCVFLGGMFFRSITGFGALVAMTMGVIIGAIRFVLEIVFHQQEQLGGDSGQLFVRALRGFALMNFLHFSVLLFWVSALVLLVASLLTPNRFRPSREQSRRIDELVYNWNANPLVRRIRRLVSGGGVQAAASTRTIDDGENVGSRGRRKERNGGEKYAQFEDDEQEQQPQHPAEEEAEPKGAPAGGIAAASPSSSGGGGGGGGGCGHHAEELEMQEQQPHQQQQQRQSRPSIQEEESSTTVTVMRINIEPTEVLQHETTATKEPRDANKPLSKLQHRNINMVSVSVLLAILGVLIVYLR